MVTGSEHTLQCQLCGSNDLVLFSEDKFRVYLRCGKCSLVFVPQNYWLSPDEEKATYDLHENGPDDKGYRKFLSRLSKPLLNRLGPKKRGLDFGCGPGPTLSVMLEEEGHCVDLYDPFYFNETSVLEQRYEFICATEVIEHIREPEKEFARLFEMLEPGGWLGIMTKLVIDQDAFRKWHYTHDLTHICFYSRSTFTYIADRFQAELCFSGTDVILMKKQIAEHMKKD